MTWIRVTTLLLMISGILLPTVKTTLDDVMPPQHLTVDKDKIYLTSKTSVAILSLKDFSIIKQFGTKGEGPGEFLSLGDDLGMTLDVRSDKLVVISRRKISYFSKTGDFIKEIKAKSGFFHIPVKSGYVGLRNKLIDKVNYRSVALYDSQFKRITDLHDKKGWFQQGKSINPITVRPPFYAVDRGLVFTEDGKGNVLIFDNKGKRIASTNLKIESVSVSDADKKEYHNYYKTHPSYRDAYAQLKHLIKFPANYPKIKFFDASDGRIYILSHVKRAGKNEMFVCDHTGKLIKKLYVEMPEMKPQAVFPIIKIRNGKVYQILENEEDEEAIDLFVSKIGL